MTIMLTLLVIAATVAMTSSHSLSWRSDNTCPCAFNTKTIVCDDASLKSIPDCVPTNVSVIIVTSADIPLVAETFQRFSKLEELRIYDVNDPQLSKDALKYLSRLNLFEIYNTNLDYVDNEWFMYAPHLETVLLHHNEIPYLAPDTFGYLPLLKTVHLDNNRLTSLSPDIFKGLNVKFLYLSANSWHCDCELARFIEWTRDNDVKILDEPVCAHPPQLEGTNLKNLTLADACTGPHY